MAFQKGQSGNPAGRPKGSLNEATRMAQALLQRDAEQIINAVIAKAVGGDMVAARIVLERLVPPAKECPVLIDLPETNSIKGTSEAQEAILKAAASGEVMLSEAISLSDIVEARRKALESTELEQRITALEDAAKKDRG